MGCVAIGSIFSLPVFLQPMSAATGWSRTAISLAMTLDFVTMGIASFGWGMLMDRVGPRIVLLAGSSVLGLGLVLASRASSVAQFQVLYGVLVGAGGGAIFAPLMATVAGWFDTHAAWRSPWSRLAWVSRPDSGADRGRARFDLRLAFRPTVDRRLGLGAVAAGRLPGAPRACPAGEGAARRAAEPPMTVRAALTSPQFGVLALTYFLCCATHSGPLFHTVSYAIACGLSVTAAVSIYSVEGFSGLAGRLAFGLLGDRFGAKRTFVSGLLLQAAAVGCYYFAREQLAFYSVAVVFGFAYAGVMPLYAVLDAREFSAVDHRDGCRRGVDGVEPGHGFGAAGRRHDFRSVWDVWMALCQLCPARAWCRRGHADLQAGAVAGNRDRFGAGSPCRGMTITCVPKPIA